MITFGQTIRAARLGFHWCPKVQAMMRISGDGPFLVELAPADRLPDNRGKGRKGDVFYRAWWEGENAAAIVDGIKPLAHIKAVKQLIRFTIGEDGDIVRSAGGVR